MPCSLRFVYTPASLRLLATAQQPNSVHKRPNPARRGPILPFVYTIAIPRPPTTQAHGATVYTNAPKRPRGVISTDLCTLLRRRPGGEAHAAGVVTQPPTHTSSRSRQNKLDISTGAREPQFQARGEGRPGVPAAGVGAMPGRRHRRPGRRGLAPGSTLASKSPLSDGACGGRPRVTSWQTCRPSPTRRPAVASSATPTSRQRRATCRRPASGRPSASAGTATAPSGLRPRPGSQGGAVGRDHGHGRLGTLSPLASIDLPAGEATSLAGETHKSPNHAGFPGITGGKYPRGDLTRVMPGDVSVHASAETRRYLATIPGRFEFVSAPRHGSWLNLVEGLLSRMARRTPRGVRVFSKDELKERILRHLGGEHRVGRLRAGVGPVGHRPDSRGARRRHSPPG